MSQQKPSIQDFATGIAEVVKLTLTQPEPQAPQTMLPADPRLVVAMNEIARLTADRDMAREWVAAQMIAHGIATGHGETVQDLVATLLHEVIRGQRAVALLRRGREMAIADRIELLVMGTAWSDWLAEIDALLEDR